MQQFKNLNCTRPVRLADGRVEFAIEHNGERIQPEARYLTPQLIRDRQGDWLRSSPVSISAAITPAELVRAASIRAAVAAYDSTQLMWLRYARYPLLCASPAFQASSSMAESGSRIHTSLTT